MGDVKNRKPVIWFDITIASSESNAYSGNACIDPSFISKTQHLAEPIPGSATSELELLRDAFTHKQRLRHPLWRHTVGPGRLMFTLLGIVFRTTRIRYYALFLACFAIDDQCVDVMLTSTLKVLKDSVELLFVLSTLNPIVYVSHDW